ncbi:hypothetical protein PN417_09990 [Halorubrum ezzemoulense]|uniref:hypothetical protein n=1 Tax=Halorubrum ezzemoulense TaxID=337243 RepID=UPI002330582F|nr:hypothetical protein [Halorubrum ezzemoulense]MDB9301265.1 hypothetical protein [Halorubrum ezzemoulense]
MATAHQDGGRDGRPPEGVNWGEDTKQAHPEYPNVEEKPPGWHNKRTDADEIRRRFGIAAFEDNYEFRPYPDCLVHETATEDRGTSQVGGTNWLATGEKGSGKSTWGLYWATRLMEVNNEAVVWRGSSSRSEWLPFKPWTRLFLPANAESSASWKPRDIRADIDGDDADLEEVVREVIYYEDPRDINEQLEPGTFNVVYPDPSFSGCAEIVAESDYMEQPVEWVPKWEADQGDATPLIHWWFAWSIAKVEYGPYDWVSLLFDETADWVPQSARADQHETFAKIGALRRVLADSRKFYFSLYFLAHHEENLHSKIRRTIQWRISMPDGTANPAQENNDRPPVGFNAIPMIRDQLSRRPVGNLIFWNETSFNKVRWDEIAEFPEDERRWLKISLSRDHARARSGVEATGGEGGEPADD